MNLRIIGIFLASLAFGAPMALAQKAVPPPSSPRLPLSTVFQGESKFQAIVAKAERENWRNLPLGERTIRVGRELVGTPYVNYSLEVDDRTESPVANLKGMDCWTYYENSLAIARMLRFKPAPYKPEDMLHMVEIERYRNGICTGSYLSRMHHLEEVFYDNQRRGYATNITSRIPGAERMHRQIQEMTVQWKAYRYLRSNPSLIAPMGKIEAQVSNLPVYQIPKSKVRSAEKYLQNGDICAITSKDTSGYTSHVGMIVRMKDRAYFTHATSDRDKGRMVVIDCPIADYVNKGSKHAGIIICRPNDVPQSPLWQNNVARQ
ncbi:MAG: N-acetylmuramoyl-L-alanine amidase-like domain-containing protein [Verrucomicrobiota bacterium]